MSHPITRRLLITLLALALTPINALADVLSEATERGTLRVGVSLFVPWTMQGADGNLKGFEVDVTRKLAADMGVTAEYKTYVWDEIIPALEKGEIDIIAAGIAITPQRALRVNFSRPYDTWGATLVTNTEKTQHIESLSALNASGTVMATVAETFAHEVSGHLFDQVDMKVFKTTDEAEAAVLSGEAIAYLVSSPEAYFFTLAHPGQVDMPLAEPLVESRAGFAVRKGEQEWLNFLNAWIEAREADNWIETAHHYWFKTVQWKDKAAE